MKKFLLPRENKPCHFLEKLLITQAISQLNKYNKDWLNTNLAKTPTSSRNCLKYSEKRVASIHGNFLPPQVCIHTHDNDEEEDDDSDG